MTSPGVVLIGKRVGFEPTTSSARRSRYWCSTAELPPLLVSHIIFQTICGHPMWLPVPLAGFEPATSRFFSRVLFQSELKGWDFGKSNLLP